MRVLHINAIYGKGGAAIVAENIVLGLRERGIDACLMVGWANKLPDFVSLLPVHSSKTYKAISKIQKKYKKPVRKKKFSRIIYKLANWLISNFGPGYIQDGVDYFGPRLSNNFINNLKNNYDVVHIHNLHGGYIDLRQIESISKSVPTIITLHDAWMLSGHCAHSFDCDKWIRGCGECPNLDIPISVNVDRTQQNWIDKCNIYKKSKLNICVPCNWLKDKVDLSILSTTAFDIRVINNGVDINYFKPHDKQEVREKLGLPRDEIILLFAANGIKKSIWKDYECLLRTFKIIGEKYHKNTIRLLALGDEGKEVVIGNAVIEFIPLINDKQLVVNYYQAADIYVHASKAETFPNTILEALACGTPVVATEVGGISEQIKSLDVPNLDALGKVWSSEKATGILTPPSCALTLSKAILYLIDNKELCIKIGMNAVEDVKARFSTELQIDELVKWYSKLCGKQSTQEF